MAHVDPISADFVLTDSGDLEAVQDADREELARRLHVERGSCFWDLSFGSRLHLLPTEKADSDVQRRAQEEVRLALAPMVRAGRLGELTVEAVYLRELGRLELEVRARTASQRPMVFSTFVSF